VWRRNGEALGQVELPPSLFTEAGAYHIHPALLDACFHLLGAPLPNELDVAYLLVGIESLQLMRPPSAQLWNHTVLRRHEGDTFTGDVTLYDTSGLLVADIRGLHLQQASAADVRRATRQRYDDLLYQVAWQPQPRSPESDASSQASVFASHDAIPGMLETAVSPIAPKMAENHQLSIYSTLLPDLDTLSRAYVQNAFKDLGQQWQPGDLFTTDELMQQSGILGKYRRLCHQLLKSLQTAGIVQQQENAWKVTSSLKTTDSAAFKIELND